MIASCLVGGFASGFLNPILGAVIYERVPDAVMGRVTTINNALCWSLMPFGGLLGGVLADGFGVIAALLAVGFAYLAATMLPLADPVVPAVRQAEARRLSEACACHERGTSAFSGTRPVAARPPTIRQPPAPSVSAITTVCPRHRG